MPWSSGNWQKKKLDSSFRLAFPTTLQSPAMHTDDAVWTGPTRSYLTPGTKGTGVFISISRELFEMKTHFTTTSSIHWMLSLKLLYTVMSRIRRISARRLHTERIVRAGICLCKVLSSDQMAGALKWEYTLSKGVYRMPKIYRPISSHWFWVMTSQSV